MTPQQSNFLMPSATFFLELLIVVVLVAGGSWLLLRFGSKRSVADKLAKLAHLRDAGALADSEFEQQKSRLLQ